MIASMLAFALAAALGAAAPDHEPPRAHCSGDAEVRALFVSAREHLARGDTRTGGTLDEAREAVRLLEETVRRDPTCAEAWLTLSDAWSRFAFSVPGSRPNAETYPHEKAAALKALALDDRQPRAHAVLADICFAEAFDWKTAESEYRRAIALAPGDASLHARLAVFLGAMARFEEAETEARTAAALAPSSPAPDNTACQILYWQHRDEEALGRCREAIRKDPDGLTGHYLAGFVYEHLGRFGEAIEETKAATVRGDAGSLSMLGYAYAVSGNRAEAERILTRLAEHTGAKNVPYRRAAIHLALGERERALELLEQDYGQRGNWLNRLKVDPIFDPLRAEPRFKALLRKLKFPG